MALQLALLAAAAVLQESPTLLLLQGLAVLLTGVVLALLWRSTGQLEAAAAAQARQQRRLQELVDALPIGMVLYDAQDRLELANRDFIELYRPLADRLQPGASFESLMRTAIERGLIPEAAGDEAGWLERRVAAHRDPGGAILRRQADGRWRRIIEQRLADGSLLAHSIDVTELVQREEQLAALNAELERLSQTDALTGLANRRAFDQRLALELARAARHGLPLVLLLADVDHFKRYNDRHGHGGGDRCLQQVALLLATQAGRPTDLVARIGGEEFALLLPHGDLATGRELAERCLAAFEARALPHGDSPVAPHVTVSIGVAVALPPDGPWRAEALLARADAALYLAKAHGRRRFVVHAES